MFVEIALPGPSDVTAMHRLAIGKHFLSHERKIVSALQPAACTEKTTCIESKDYLASHERKRLLNN